MNRTRQFATFFVVILLRMVVIGTPRQDQVRDQPALPYVDNGACPGEYCGYGRWKAVKPAAVYDTWQATRRKIAEISVGKTVVAHTGLVITSKPGVIRMDRDLPDQD